MDSARSIRRRKGEGSIAFFLLAPSFAGFLVFSLIPMAISLAMSFTSWDLFNPPAFIGLGNYRAILQDSAGLESLRHTLFFCLVNIPIGAFLAPLLLAVLMNQDLKGEVVFRTLFFLPVVTLSVSSGFIWTWMFNPDYGIINYLLSLFDIPGKKWLLSPKMALSSLIVVNVWKWTGYNMIIYLAALKGIPRTYYEAAKIDGSSAVSTFTKITLPLLAPTTFFVVLMGIIGSLQFFDLVYIMTQGGPGTSTMVFNYYIFQSAFKYSRMGYASALSWLLFALIMIATLLQMKMGKRGNDYAD